MHEDMYGNDISSGYVILGYDYTVFDFLTPPQIRTHCRICCFNKTDSHWDLNRIDHYYCGQIEGTGLMLKRKMFERMGFIVDETNGKFVEHIMRYYCPKCFKNKTIKHKSTRQVTVHEIKSKEQIPFLQRLLPEEFSLYFTNNECRFKIPYCNDCYNLFLPEFNEIVAEYKTKYKNMMISDISESQLERMLSRTINLVEDGMTFLGNQKKHTDILARDKNGKLCIIELKVVKDDPRLVGQCMSYPKKFNENVRMITICPDYSDSFHQTLKDLPTNVETKRYRIYDGMLIVEDFVPSQIKV